MNNSIYISSGSDDNGLRYFLFKNRKTDEKWRLGSNEPYQRFVKVDYIRDGKDKIFIFDCNRPDSQVGIKIARLIWDALIARGYYEVKD